MFEVFESVLLELSPDPGLPFASEKVKEGDDVRKVQDEFPVEVCKSSKQPNFFNRGRGFPFLYSFQLFSIHFDLSLSNDHA